MTRRMTWDEHFAEIEALGAKIHAELPVELREKHRIDRSRLSQNAQCVCTCGAVCQFWVAHLQDVRSHAEYWERVKDAGRGPIAVMLGAGQFEPNEIGACCEHEYGRHLVGLDGCADCERWEPEHARCTGWERQLPG
jgi:hypothetical protein